jgi:hypothetical protein
MTKERRQDASSTHIQDVAALLRSQVREVHEELDTYVTAWMRALAPGSVISGSLVPLLYLHGMTVEDVAIHSLLLRDSPLFATAWNGTGLARYAPVDMASIRSYAQQVYAATDTYLACLTVDELSRTVDLSGLSLGQQTVAWIVSHFVVLELAHLGGELMQAAHVPGAADHPCSFLYRK